MDTIFIPPIVNIIEDYMAPDYKQMYDHVLRDFNWAGVTYAKMLAYNTLINNDDDSDLDHIFPKVYNEEYDTVIGELKLNRGVNPHDVPESRFWMWAK